MTGIKTPAILMPVEANEEAVDSKTNISRNKEVFVFME
jgi:hypothetical protein